MFRPELHHTDDPELIAARDAAFEILYRAVEAGLDADQHDDVTGTAMAAWSAVHGFAALWLNGNFPSELTEDPDGFATLIIRGFVHMGRITERQAAPTPAADD